MHGVVTPNIVAAISGFEFLSGDVCVKPWSMPTIADMALLKIVREKVLMPAISTIDGNRQMSLAPT
ncbi:Uncharacterised protein [Chlamydia trachomatis]|nr:Uncharacterised protein [Chlamydia trachomatis]